MYESCKKVVRCVVGVTEEFKVEVRQYRGSPLSPFLFAMVMDRPTDEVRQESLWTTMFADDIVICKDQGAGGGKARGGGLPWRGEY